MMMTKFVPLMLGLAQFASAGATVSFQTHYLPFGQQESPVAIACDAAGDLFIVTQVLDPMLHSSVRIFKTDPQGRVVGKMDLADGVTPADAAVDPQGNLLVVGSPGMVAKIDNNLSTILASTSIPGGNSYVRVFAIATDSAGHVYLTGSAGEGFPTTPGSYKPHGVPSSSGFATTYGFVANLSPDLNTILYATLFGGDFADCSPFSGDPRSEYCLQHGGAQTQPNSIAVDASGSVIVAGSTNGGGPSAHFEPYFYGFAAKFSPDLSTLQAAVFLTDADFAPLGVPETAGPGKESFIRDMALDRAGNVILVGDGEFSPSKSPGGTLQPLPPSDLGTDIFVVKLSNDLGYLWGTFFGAAYTWEYNANGRVAVDSAGNVWITAAAQINSLPGSTSTSDANSPFAAELTPDGLAIVNMASSQFGGGPIVITPHDGAAILGSRGTADSLLLTAPPDRPSLLMVANSANSHSSGTIAPMELLSLFGAGIGPDSPLSGQVVDGAFGKSLGGYQALFNGIPAPLLYAGPDQINVVSPAGIADQSTVDIEVIGPHGTTVFPTVFVSPARPQIFSQLLPYTPGCCQPPSPTAFAIAYNQDGIQNSESNPAPAGSIVTIWATGTGLLQDPLPDGDIAKQTSAPLLPLITPNVITFTGQAPGVVQGLTQINLQVPGGSGNLLWVNFQQGESMTEFAHIWISK
jgi:uncharacterized protein (TIGR03437 family)